MTLHENNWLLRIAFFVDGYVPRTVSLCALFWRLVVTLLAITVVVGYLGLFGYAFYKQPKVVLEIIGLVAAAFWVIILIHNRKEITSRSPEIVKLAYTGIKNRFCPIIQIEKAEE